MKKTKTMRRVLLALLATLFALTLSFAVARVVPARAETTYTDKTQENGLVVGVSEGGWTLDNEEKPNKYTAVAGGAAAVPALRITVQGEKYISFEYCMSACTATLSANYNRFTFDIDSIQYAQIGNDQTTELKNEYIIKTHGEGEHEIVIYANAATSGAAGMYWQNIQIRDMSEVEKKPLKISYDATKESIFLIESANNGFSNDVNDEETLKKIAIYIEPEREYQLPVNTFFALEHLSKEVTSSIDGETPVKMWFKADHLTSETDNKVLSSKGNTSTREGYKITETGIELVNTFYPHKAGTHKATGYALKDECTLEEAVEPTVSLYYDGEEHPLEDKASELTMPEGKDSVSLCIKSILPDYESVYTVTGEGAEFSDWEEDMGVISRSLSLTREGTVTITINIAYDGTKYHNASKTFTFSFYTPSKGGLRDILAFPSAENITEIIDDGTYPWKYDAARSDGGMAYSSGISESSEVANGKNLKKISQIGFKVKGSGVLVFDLQIDGYGTVANSEVQSQSFAAFHIGGPVTGSIGLNFPSQGFGKTVASNLAYGLSTKTSSHVHSRMIGETFAYTDGKSYTDAFYKLDDGHEVKLIEEGDGYEWYTVSIPIDGKADTEETAVYLAHGVSANYKAVTHMTVRNVGFYPKDTSVSFAVGDGETSAVSNSKISVKAGERNIALKADGTPDTSTPISRGERLTLTAKPSEGEVFYGWQEVSGDKTKIISYDITTDYVIMSAEVTIVAVIAPKGTIAVRNGGKFYKTAKVQDAFDAARDGEDKTVIAIGEATLTGELTLHAGVTFVIPYNTDGEYQGEGKTSNATLRVSWATDYSGNTMYRTPFVKLTLDTGATLTVNGKFYVGGVLHYPDQSAQGHTSGAYSEFVNNGTVTVASGGMMDVCGRVTGKGGITVQSGGKLYQPFMILDYAGGTNTEAMFDDAHVTPFKMYAMVNIQCEGGYTIEYGGVLFGHASLYFYSSITAIEQPFITYEDEEGNLPEDAKSGLLIMKKGSKIKSVYDDSHKRVTGVENVADVGKTTMTINGDVKAGYMDFLGMVKTEDVNFSLPYNYEVNIESGNFTVANHFKLMPGAVVRVGEKATATVVAGKSLHVYDSFLGPKFAKREYPTGAQLTAADYKPYASLIVNGKLVIEGNATFVGTVQTEGKTGRIEIGAGAKLTASLSDGVATQYGCNYTKYTLTARVWDEAHKTMAPLTAGKNYTAVGPTTGWTLPGIEFQYEQNPSSHKGGGSHSLKTETTASVSDMVGSWMVEHEGHSYDWTKKAGDELPGGETKHTTLTRSCQELGCTAHDERELLLVPENWGHVTFTGKAFTDAEVQAAVNKMFGGYDLFATLGTVSFTPFTNASAEGYDVTVTLNEGKAFWVTGDAYDMSGLARALRLFVDKATLTDGDVAMDTADETYTGSAITKAVTVTFNGLTLQAGEDYQVEYSANTDVGTATVTIESMGNNFNETSIERTFRIVACSLSDAQVTWDEGSKTYTGAKIMPNVTRVTVNGRTLTAEKDYTVTYGDNLNVGSGTITITGQTNYKDTKELTFVITQKDAGDEATVTIEGTFTYTGSEQTPEAKVELAGFELIPETDYKVSYSDNKDAGTATVNVTFDGNFTGTAEGKFTIGRKDISAGDVTVSGVEDSYEYADKAITPEVTVRFGELELVSGGDREYTVVYGANKDVATGGTVTLTGRGNYQGTKELKFTITQKDASTARITVTSTHTYDGNDQTVTVTVTLEGYTITEKDYSISYTGDRKNASEEVAFTVNYTGNYSGSTESSFRIARANVTITPERKSSPKGQDLAGLTAAVEGLIGDDIKQFTKDTDYGITTDATPSSEPGTYDITVTLKTEDKWTNYMFTVNPGTDYYTITPEVFGKVVFQGGQSTVYDGTVKTHEAELINPEGIEGELTAEYTYKLGGEPTEMKAAGIYTVEAALTFKESGEGGRTYTTTLTVEYTITRKPVTVTLKAQEATYNGKAQSAQTGESYYGIAEDAIIGDDDVTFTLSSAALTDVGSTPILLEVGGAAENNYNVQKIDAQFTVKPLALQEKSLTVTSTHVYNGELQTPAITVTVMSGSESLTVPAGDYTVTYEGDRTDAGTGTVKVTMQEGKNFSGNAETSFTIDKAPIATAAVTGSYIYDRTAKMPELVVTATGGGSKSLTLAKSDYTVEIGGDHTNVGDVNVTVTAAEESNYKGTMSASFTIKPATIGSFTIDENRFTYDGTEHRLTLTVKAGTLTLTAEEYDLTQDGSLKDAGTATLKVKGKGNFAGETTLTQTVTIDRAPLTKVSVTSTHVYDGTMQTPELAVTAAGGDKSLTPTENDYTVEYTGSRTKAGTVTVKVNGTGNYTGEAETTFAIEKAEITVKLGNTSSMYGDDFAELPFTYEGVIESDKASVHVGDYLNIVTEATSKKSAGKYAITATVEGTETLANYTVRVAENGEYTVEKRRVRVRIQDQSATYREDARYTFTDALWTLLDDEESDGLAPNETQGMLGIELSVGTLGDAGEYVITADWTNENYAVTFVGNYAGQGEWNARGGVYRIEKRDVSREAEFVLLINGDGAEKEDSTVRTKYAGEPLVLSGRVIVLVGMAEYDLEGTVEPGELDDVGTYTVTVSVETANYRGSSVFTVIVADKEGYTEELRAVIARLAELAAQLNGEGLTAEDYPVLVEMYTAIDGLSADERETGAERLAEYEAYLAAWKEAADIDDVIETAEMLGSAPFEALFEAAATLTALAGLAYIATKGGLL